MHFWHDQELVHLHEYVNEVQQDTRLGLKWGMTTEQLRLETGFPGPFTDVPYATMHTLTTDSRIKTLWHYCSEHGLSIADPFGDLTRVRTNDVLLMPHFEQKYGHDIPFLKRLNQCRMHLHAVSLADLCSMRGDRMLKVAYEGTQECPGIRILEWP